MINEKDVRELIEAREEQASAKKRVAELKAIYAADFEAEREASARVKNAETTLRGQIVASYEENGEKTQAFGMKVRASQISRLVYDEEKAVEFAQKHPEFGLMKLDVEAFENAAAGLKLDFVSVETGEKVTPMIPKEIRIDE